MDMNDILSKCDHTLLKQTATWKDVKTICDEANDNGCHSVCIPPTFVKQAAEYLHGKSSKVTVCTVIGFPNGYSTTKVKVYETEQAILDGADEIDMVINLGYVKEKKDAELLEEIRSVKEACHGRLLKVIIETCLLTEEEKMRLAKIVTEAKADYIKTSTGFSTGGATPQDVALLKANVGRGVKVKASGGIKSLEDADLLIKLGASRLGTSKVVQLYLDMKKK